MKRGNGEPRRDGDEEEVGYGKPPKRFQWEPGKSGNPKGRPPGAKGKHKFQDAILQRARETLLEEGKRKITFREGDKVMTMDAYTLAVRATFMAAAKGSAMAQSTVIKLTMAAEAEVSATMTGLFREMAAYKENCARERLRCHKAGLPQPIFPIDPDQIVLDWEHLTVEYHGPLWKQLQGSLRERLQCRDEWADDFDFCRARYDEKEPEIGSLTLVLQSQRNYDVINESLPPRYRKPLIGRFSEAEIFDAFERLRTDSHDPQADGSAALR